MCRGKRRSSGRTVSSRWTVRNSAWAPPHQPKGSYRRRPAPGHPDQARSHLLSSSAASAAALRRAAMKHRVVSNGSRAWTVYFRRVTFPYQWKGDHAGRSTARHLVWGSSLHHEARARRHHAVFIHLQLPVAGQTHFEPLERPGRGTVHALAVAAEHAAVARAMKARIVLEVFDRAAEMGADRAGHGKSFFPVAEDVDFLFRQESRRAERTICGVADLEGLRRLIKHARGQKADHRAQAHADGGPQRHQPRRSPIQELSSFPLTFSQRLIRIPRAPAAPALPW